MGVISKPNTFSPNTTMSSSQVNSNFDTIYNEFNGNIAAANLATGAVTTAKIADSNVTTAKIADSNVTTAKIADGAATFAKLATDAIAVKYTEDNTWSESTSFNNVNSLSLEAGVWLIIATLNFNCATASVRVGQMRIYNSTDASDISGSMLTRIENASSDNSSVVSATRVVTLAGTKTIAMQAAVSDTSGTNTVARTTMAALRLTSVS